MIISHKYKFIFLKTRKTAGTSLEVFLAQYCGEEDVITPIYEDLETHRARNFEGWFNPLPELKANRRAIVLKHFDGKSSVDTRRRFFQRMKYYNHIHGNDIKLRAGDKIWNEYYKFTIERNPWDKTLSHYHWQNHKHNTQLSFAEYLESGVFCINYPIYTDRYADDVLLVDQVIKYENLDEEFGGVCERLGIPYEGKLTVETKSNLRTDWRSYHEVMSKEQLNQIEQIFRKEIDLHGFTYE